MKTLFLFSTASGYGGAEKSLEAVFTALTGAFHVVAFVENDTHQRALENATPAGRSTDNPEATTPRIIRLRGKNTPGAWARNIAGVRKAWRRSPPDVLLSNTNKGALWISLCQRFSTRSVPAFLFVRDFGWQLRPLIFSTLRNWSAIVPAQAVPDSAYWRRWLAGAPIHIVPNAAPRPTVSQPPANPGDDYVLCLANLSRWKGVDLLIRAFADAAVPRLRLIIQGAVTDPIYRAELGQLVATLGLGDAVVFREFGHDVHALYANSRLVAVPSISTHGGPESFGRTVIEAWSHGKPVVAFACGGPKYLIRDGVDGFLVPEKDTLHLSQKIRSLACDARLAGAMGEAGQHRAATEFSVEAVAAALLHTLNRPLNCDVTRLTEARHIA